MLLVESVAGIVPIIIPQTDFVVRVLTDNKQTIIGATSPTDALNRAFVGYGIRFVTTSDPDSKITDHDMVGVVRAETDQMGIITLTMEDDLSGVVNNHVWPLFVDVLTEVIGHELIHRQQFTLIAAGKLKYTPPREMRDRAESFREYLSNVFEMAAYAYQSYQELRRNDVSDDAINAALDAVDFQLLAVSPMFSRYLKFFATTDDAFILFTEYVREYAEQL